VELRGIEPRSKQANAKVHNFLLRINIKNRPYFSTEAANQLTTKPLKLKSRSGNTITGAVILI